ncbi:MAG: hypothetical protein HY913_12560 [Desulfomonile tiedjei]|nr:hypothetical protein [Desulfomonile tiedjei]
MSSENARQGSVPFGDHDTVTLRLTCDAEGLPSFYPLLQHGVLVKARLGVSVRKVLCDQLGVSSKYLDERIKTVFLDGQPVDDVDTAMVTEGSTIALSAALPGFVGAALRKGGFYSRMRAEISHSGRERASKAAEGFFVLKLYNLVLPELGPHFLEAGFWVSIEDLNSFISVRSTRFWEGLKRAEIDGHQVDSGAVRDQGWATGRRVVFLAVKASSAEGA